MPLPQSSSGFRVGNLNFNMANFLRQPPKRQPRTDTNPVRLPGLREGAMKPPSLQSNPMGAPMLASNPIGIPRLQSNPIGTPMLASNPLGMPRLQSNPVGVPMLASNPLMPTRRMDGSPIQPGGLPAMPGRALATADIDATVPGLPPPMKQVAPLMHPTVADRFYNFDQAASFGNGQETAIGDEVDQLSANMAAEVRRNNPNQFQTVQDQNMRNLQSPAGYTTAPSVGLRGLPAVPQPRSQAELDGMNRMSAISQEAMARQREAQALAQQQETAAEIMRGGLPQAIPFNKDEKNWIPQVDPATGMPAYYGPNDPVLGEPSLKAYTAQAMKARDAAMAGDVAGYNAANPGAWLGGPNDEVSRQKASDARASANERSAKRQEVTSQRQALKPLVKGGLPLPMAEATLAAGRGQPLTVEQMTMLYGPEAAANHPDVLNAEESMAMWAGMGGGAMPPDLAALSAARDRIRAGGNVGDLPPVPGPQTDEDETRRQEAVNRALSATDPDEFAKAMEEAGRPIAEINSLGAARFGPAWTALYRGPKTKTGSFPVPSYLPAGTAEPI